MDIRILHDFGKIFCLKRMGRIVYRSCIEINLDIIIIKKGNQLRYNNILSKFHSHHTQMPRNFIGTFQKKKEEFYWETRILITYSYTKTSSLLDTSLITTESHLYFNAKALSLFFFSLFIIQWLRMKKFKS